jgi:hypothetical protein
VLGGFVLYPLSQGREALRFFHEFSATCPDEVSTVSLLLSAPDGSPAVGIAACYTGPINEGERILKPLRTFGSPIADLIALRRYTEMQSLFEQNWVPGQLNYWKTSLMRAPTDEAIEVLLESAQKRPTPNSVIYFQQAHGAASRVKPTDTASRIGSIITTVDCGQSGTIEQTPTAASVGHGNAGMRSCHSMIQALMSMRSTTQSAMTTSE